MLPKTLYIIIFLMTLSCLGQDDTCKKNKRIDLNSISKCLIVKPNVKARARTITTRTRTRIRTRIRKTKALKIKKIALETKNTAKNVALKKENKKVAKLDIANKKANELEIKNIKAIELETAKKLAKIRKATELASKVKISKKTVETLPLSLVEIKPLFSNCGAVSTDDQTKCFTNEINKHISQNFKYPEMAYKKGVQGRVLVQFVIDEQGIIGKIKTSGPFKGEELDKEALRIIKEIPKFKAPGKIGSNVVKVKYNLAINFKINGVTPTNTRLNHRENVIVDDVKNMTSVETLPLFKNCVYVAKASQKKCFIEGMINHINNNIQYPETAVNNNIQGRIYTQFIITKEGYIVNIITKGPKGTEALKEEAKRIISSLPKLMPAKLNGQRVNVKHTLPITFKL